MEIDPDNLGGFIDWNEDNILDNLSALLQLESPHAGFANTNVLGSSISSGTRETAAASPFVPNPLLLSVPNSSASLLNEAPSNHVPFSSAVGLNLGGPVSSIQDQDMTQSGYFNQFSGMQNENFYGFQGIGVSDNNTPSNQTLAPNMIENNNFSGVNNPIPPYPAMFQPNPVQARPGIETGHPSGQFVINQTPTCFSPDNHISNSYSEWNPRPEHNQVYAPNVHGSQYAANYSQSPHAQSFATLQNQVGHASEMQNVFGLQSQNSMQPVYPMYPRSEQYSTLQSSFLTMPPNPYQHEYRSEPPVPVAPPPASSLANYGQQPSFFATTTNSFGSGSSVPPAYPPMYANQGRLNQPQVMMPNVHEQQSGTCGQLWSQGVTAQINEYNRGINTSNLQWQSNTLREPTVQSSSFTSSQALSSTRILGLSSTRATEGTSSQFSNPREAEVARRSSGHQVVTAPANEVRTHRNKGKLPASSSTGSQPSEAIRRILDMNPTRTVTHNTPVQQNGRGNRTYDLGRQLSSLREGHYEPPRRGRPPKRRDPEESSSRRGKKASSETGRARATPTIQQAQNIPAVNRVQNAIPANPVPGPRQYVNTVYDLNFEKNGDHIDPHLRFFKPPPKK